MGPVAVDEETAATYIYPKHPDYPERQYQSEMTETALNYNTLVSLPTGLGKTHIAAVVMYNYYRWFAKGGGKIIFCAPTLPLVNQQLEACFRVVGIPGTDTAVMTGKMNAEKRKELWKTKRLFFCTPQTVQRDLMTADNEIDHETSRAFSKVVCLVLDEAHKASGDYAYTRVVELLENAAHAKFRIVGLSATPGATIKAIQGVVEALRSVKIEARTDTDDTVAPYLHTKRTEIVIVERNNYQREIERLISNILHPYLEKLREDHLLQTYGNATLTSYSIIKALETYKKNNANNLQGPLLATFFAVQQLIGIRNDCHQSLGVVKMKLLRLRQGPNRGILSKIVKSEEFETLVGKVIEATDGGGGGGIDPKLIKLSELLKLHFERENACGNSSRAIVFAQFRDNVKEIVDCLKRMEPLVKSRYFVGQNKGSNNTKKSKKKHATNDNNNNDNTTSAVPFLDERVAGMKQAEQHQAIKDFVNNRFNVLVCTSIGEEGLDIGNVDLIINYDVIRSPIRMIQRAGRTGRKRDGRVVSLISEGQEEQTHKSRLSAERTLVNALK
ncbi:P-loop containing nucleoside triphosphate hydrolase protein, partial [Fragilariopsis cylindrus CCMP1102]